MRGRSTTTTLQTREPGNASEKKSRQDLQRAKKEKDKRETDAERLRDFHDYLLKAAAATFQEKPQKTQNTQPPARDFQNEIAEEPYSDRVIDIPDHILEIFPYNKTFGQRMAQWMRQLRWPGPQSPESRTISALELYIDFCLTTKSLAPVNVVPKHQRTSGKQIRYELRDMSVQADMAERSLTTQSQTWSRALQWLLRNNPEMTDLKWVKGHSMSTVGFYQQFASLDRRPRLAQGARSHIVLNGYFRRQQTAREPPSRRCSA